MNGSEAEIDSSRLFTTMVGKSAAWNRVLAIIKRVLDVDVAVLITGESGTGKELVARAVHDGGLRQGKPFVTVNCSAIPEQLIESELFGYVKGAFTGASFDKKGLVEVAEEGTLFLDEVADLPVQLQPEDPPLASGERISASRRHKKPNGRHPHYCRD